MKKRIMIIGLVIIGIVVLIVVLFNLIQVNRQKRYQTMNSTEMIKEVTKNDKNTKISIAIIKDDEVEFKVYGENAKIENNLDYQYEIGSISKTFVGLLISKAIEENKINIDDSIDKYLDLDNDKYYPTIKRLLTHTSGYKEYYINKQFIKNIFNKDNMYYNISKDKIINKVNKVNLKDKDYNFKYSNFGIGVLGLVLEEVYNQDFITLTSEFIKNDLKLNNTKVATGAGNLKNYWQWKKDDGYIPAGAIISNITDMVEYLKIYLNSTDDYINNTTKELTSVDINENNNELNIRVDKIGMTWMIDDLNNITWHNGSTSHFNSYFGFNKEKKYGVIILSNISAYENISMTFIGTKLMQEIKNN